MTQVDIIRKQLLKGNTLTQRSALLDFNIMALPRRIADLKEQGLPIQVEMKSNPHTGQRYASYSLLREVTHIDQLKDGCVYRIFDVEAHPFHPPTLQKCQGYFTVVRDPSIIGVEVMMAGRPQTFNQGWLNREDFKVEYIGGMS